MRAITLFLWSHSMLASRSDRYKTQILFLISQKAFSKTTKFSHTKISGFIQHEEHEIPRSHHTNPTGNFERGIESFTLNAISHKRLNQIGFIFDT